ncbi:hypothetical protein HPB52_024127 [Rhipicephalus sanguineus]|uniref:Uncharacterized protein n=1 Tax=Rhipicephalus sanguineus TaxID=34632 RepID=A0A9D4T6L9_RHISA|nr:hypothetical protein HPB52_024127 [Rhipicephalus sanguineus]
MSGMSVADLVKCRDASVLLGAFNMHTNDDGDDEIHDFFFAPGLERLELLCWVLVAIDPSGKHERELNTGEDSAAALTKRATSVLSHLNPRRVKEFAAFARGTAPIEQLEEAILVSKKRLAALEASQEPEEPPLDAPLCARYRRAAEELARAGDCMAQATAKV